MLMTLWLTSGLILTCFIYFPILNKEKRNGIGKIRFLGLLILGIIYLSLGIITLINYLVEHLVWIN